LTKVFDFNPRFVIWGFFFVLWTAPGEEKALNTSEENEDEDAKDWVTFAIATRREALLERGIDPDEFENALEEAISCMNGRLYARGEEDEEPQLEDLLVPVGDQRVRLGDVAELEVVEEPLEDEDEDEDAEIEFTLSITPRKDLLLEKGIDPQEFEDALDDAIGRLYNLLESQSEEDEEPMIEDVMVTVGGRQVRLGDVSEIEVIEESLASFPERKREEEEDEDDQGDERPGVK